MRADSELAETSQQAFINSLPNTADSAAMAQTVPSEWSSNIYFATEHGVVRCNAGDGPLISR